MPVLPTSAATRARRTRRAAFRLPAQLLAAALLAPGASLAAQQAAPTTPHAPPVAPSVRALRPVGFRPGLSEGTGITPRGRLVVEVGASIEGARGDGSGTTRAGEIVAHVPVVTHRAELRVGMPSYTWQAPPRATAGAGEVRGTESGFAALALRLTDGGAHPSWRSPIVAMTLQTSLPVGSLPGTDRAWQPLTKLLVEVPASPTVTVMGNAGVRRAGTPGDRFAVPFTSAWVHRKLGARAGGYGEAMVAFRPARAGAEQVTTHGGVTYLLSGDHHLDVHVGRVVQGGRGTFGGVGLMTRF